MNKKVQQYYETLAMQNGLRVDLESEVIFGKFGGYNVQLLASNGNQPYMFTLNFAVRRAAQPLTKEESKEFTKQYKQIISLQEKQNLVQVLLRGVSNQTKLQENLSGALRAVTDFLRLKGYEPCCQNCGELVETESYMIGNAAMQICSDCCQNISQSLSMQTQQEEHTKENLIGGIVGALLGSLIGALCILLLSQLGYVSALSGIVMAVCTLKGYEMLGKKLTTRGVVVSVIIMGAITLITNRLDWAIFIAKELDWGVGYAYQMVSYFLEEGAIEVGNYYGNLAMIAIFAVLGAVPMVRNTLHNQKNKGRVHKMR